MPRFIFQTLELPDFETLLLLLEFSLFYEIEIK